MGAELFHAEEQTGGETDMQKHTVSQSLFAISRTRLKRQVV